MLVLYTCGTMVFFGPVVGLYGRFIFVRVHFVYGHGVVSKTIVTFCYGLVQRYVPVGFVNTIVGASWLVWGTARTFFFGVFAGNVFVHTFYCGQVFVVFVYQYRV